MSQVSRLVIVGGGIAGWLTAAYMARTLCDKVNHDIHITLVESPGSTPVGVGEGCWPSLRNTLAHLGISENRFMQECQATFNQGTRFENWRHHSANSNNDAFYHLFDTPALNWPVSPVPFWLSHLNDDPHPFADSVSIQQQVCEAGLAPKQLSTPEFQGHLNYGYHVDAGKFANLLSRVASYEMGVSHIQADLTHVHHNAAGDITHITTRQAGDIAGDLFIDCTGFSSRLLAQSMNVPFVDYSHILLADRAIAMQVPYSSENTEIPPYTRSVAQDAGWVWDIGLRDRRGTGYVYRSADCSDAQARDALMTYLGDEQVPGYIRVIPLRPGRRAKAWHHNCVAIGMSAGFIEPLESCALLMIEDACKQVADIFPAKHADMPHTAALYNDTFVHRWDNVVEFIKLHYVLSGREDTSFWLDNKRESTWPAGLKQKLLRWQSAPPASCEFPDCQSLFTREHYEFILFGMQSEKQLHAMAESYGKASDLARMASAALEERWGYTQAKLSSHRALLKALEKDRFPRAR